MMKVYKVLVYNDNKDPIETFDFLEEIDALAVAKDYVENGFSVFISLTSNEEDEWYNIIQNFTFIKFWF